MRLVCTTKVDYDIRFQAVTLAKLDLESLTSLLNKQYDYDTSILHVLICFCDYQVWLMRFTHCLFAYFHVVTLDYLS